MVLLVVSYYSLRKYKLTCNLCKGLKLGRAMIVNLVSVYSTVKVKGCFNNYVCYGSSSSLV